MFYKDERLALFIDGSNLYAAAKALGFDIMRAYAGSWQEWGNRDDTPVER